VSNNAATLLNASNRRNWTGRHGATCPADRQNSRAGCLSRRNDGYTCRRPCSLRQAASVQTASRLSSRCKQCQNATTNRKKLDKRNIRKEQFIELMGGCCQRCGYHEFPAGLDFHHVNRSEKEISPATIMDPAFSWEEARLELDKCVLLCANCHRAIEASQLEIEFSKRDGLGYTATNS
jgi:hypothetical protein